MNSDNMIAKAVGALFIITMVFGGINAYFISPILHTSFTNIFQNKTLIVTGVILEIFMGIGVAGIAVFLFPILIRHSKNIAYGYLGLRVIEVGIMIITVISPLLMIELSQEFIKSGTTDSLFFQNTAILLLEGKSLIYQAAFFFTSLSGLILCYSLYETKLIPRIISAIGFIGYLFLFLSAVLDLLGFIDTVNGAGVYMYLPGGLFELAILPAWLIVKGFNTVQDSN